MQHSYTNKRIHFVGISGIGMSAIAQVLARRGVFVTGSDMNRGPIFRRLARLGGQCWLGHHHKHIQGAELVVYSPAVPRDNCELEAARKKGIPTIPRAKMLNILAEESECIGISGSHGKSTTSWLVGHLLLEAGLDPTIMVGAKAEGLKGNARDGLGKYFVAEVCESDGIFANLKSALAVVTNIDAEHLDYYASLEDVQEHFRCFINNSADRLGAVVWADDEHTMSVAQSSEARFITYGFGEADLRARVLQISGKGSVYEVDWNGRSLGKFRTPLLGRFNVLNTLAAVAVGLRLEIPLKTIRKSIAVNAGVDRRLSLRGCVRGIMLWDDYGHHPTETQAALEALRPAVKGKLIVVFQPHRYTRTSYLSQEFGRSFSLADHLLVTQIYPAGEQPVEGVTGRLIVDEAHKQNHPSAEFIAEKEFIPARLTQLAQPGDAILFQGAGDINRQIKETAQQLKSEQVTMTERNVG